MVDEETVRGPAVVVAGSGRCGSSLVTDILRSAGLSLGPPELYGTLTGPNAQRLGVDGDYAVNPRGYWELPGTQRVNDELIVRALGLAGPAAWMRCLPTGQELAEAWRKPVDPSLREAVTAHVLRVRGGGGMWVVKDPRFCYTLPFWLPSIPDPVRVVHSVRHPLSVARSVTRIAGSLGEPMSVEDAVGQWVIKNEALSHACRHWDLPTIVVSYERLVQEGWPAIRRLLRFVSVAEADSEARRPRLLACIDPALNRNDVTSADAREPNWEARYPQAAALYASLLRLAARRSA